MKRLIIPCLIFVIMMITSAHADLTDGNIGYWDFDSPTIIDKSGFHSNGVNYNSTVHTTTGCLNGGCFDFDGIGHEIEFFDTPIDDAEIKTICTWIYPNNVNGIYVLSFEDTDTGTGERPSYIALGGISAQINDEQVSFFDSAGSSGGTKEASYYTGTQYDIDVDEWLFICGRESLGHYNIYLNGTSVTTQFFNGGMEVRDTNVGSVTASAHISKMSTIWYSDGNQRQTGLFEGLIDGVYMWNRTLTTDEITELYNNGLGNQFRDLGDINLTYPQNDTYFNDWNGSLEIETGEPYTNCTINDTRFDVDYNNGTIFRFVNNTEFVSDLYKFEIQCNLNATSKSLFIEVGVDTVFPTIDIIEPADASAFSLNTTSAISFTENYIDNHAIHDYNFTIFYPNGSVLYNQYQTNISGVSDVKIVNLSYVQFVDNTFPTGEYRVQRTVRDTHTKRNILKKLKRAQYFKQDVNVVQDRIIQRFNDKEQMKYRKNKNIVIEFENLNDKVIMKFKNLKRNQKNSYIIESDYPIYYYPASENYNCHIVTGNMWSDCNGLENANLEFIDAKTVRVNFYPTKTTATSESTGFLNSYSANTTFLLTLDSGTPTEPTQVNIDAVDEDFNQIIIALILYVLTAILFLMKPNEITMIFVSLSAVFVGVEIYERINIGAVPLIFILINLYLAFTYYKENKDN